MANQRGRASPKQSARPAAAKADWDRDQFAARFTEDRRARLREIAAGMPPGTTPVQAVDRAVELALAAKRGRLDEPSALGILEDRLDRLDASVADEARAAREVADTTLRQVRELAGLLSAVSAAAPGGDDADGGWEGGQAPAAMSLRAWLDARGATLRSVCAVARWRSKSRLTDQHVAMEFEIGVAGATSPRSTVRAEPLAVGSALARADSIAALSLDCRRDPRGGWLVSARSINSDRSIGQPLGEIKV